MRSCFDEFAYLDIGHLFGIEIMMFSTYPTCQGSSPLASAILVISVLLLFVAAMLALLQRRKEIPAWTGPIGR